MLNKRVVISSLILTLFSIIAIALCSILLDKKNHNVVLADSQEYVAQNVTGEREISATEIDALLYMELMYVRDGSYPDANDSSYIKLKTTDFSSLEELKLEDVRDGELRMTDVSGLGLFDFSNLKKLNLSDNYLTSIPSRTFANMTNLEELDVTGNNLTTLEFGSLESIKILKARNNSLTSVNLSKISANADIDLAFNNISDIDTLELKKDGQNAKVDLYGNKITNFDANNYENYIMIIGFQNHISTYNEKTIIKNYKFDNQEFWLECKNQDTLQVTNILTSGSLVPGKYEIRLRDENAYYNYNVIEIVVKKSAPTFIITNEKGEEVDYSKVIKEKIKITFSSGDENYNIEYSINGTQFVRGNVVILEKTGSYSFNVRAVNQANNVSQVYTFTVEMNIKQNNFWKYFAIILSIFVVAGLVYGGYKFYLYKSNGKKINKSLK